MSIIRTTTTLLKLAVALSSPAGAIFGYLAWQEQKSSSPDMTAAANNTATLVRQSGVSLEQEEVRLSVQRAMLLSLDRLLPEAEKSRLGIERLVQLTERGIDDVRAAKKLQERPPAVAGSATKPPAKSKAPAVAGWWETYGPNSELSRKAIEIWNSVPQR